MDYEKKYNDALNWMRELYPGLHGATKEDAEHYFPELKESEESKDERIRKAIVELVKRTPSSMFDADTVGKWIGASHDEILAYLEKQKEQKPSINIDQLKSLMLQYLQEASNEKEDSDIEADTDKWARKILGYDFEQKPAEWSEEDEKMLLSIINAFRKGAVSTIGQEQWLKSLPERFNLQSQAKQEQKEPSDKGEISDGYHTFNELYYYRLLYNAAFFNLLPKEWVHKSKRHHDGEECFGGGWFIVMANLPTGQISNHYEIKYWDLFHIPEKETADKWDGHTPQEAAERLHKFLLEMPNLMPVEYLPKEKVYDIMRKLNMLSLSDIIPFRSEEYNEINEIESEVHDLLNYPIEKKQEQKPVEWSEEDKETIDLTIAVLRENIPNSYFKTNPANTLNMGAISTDELINRLKSLLPQPKEEQKEHKPEVKLTGWVARDKDGEIYVYGDCPEKDSERPIWIGSNSIDLYQESFPNLKWEDEPVEVEIIIRKK